jgi:uncharacterized protein (TIGR02246 family)
MNSDDQAIRALHATWIDAVNAGDLAKLLGWMTDDCVLLGPGQPPLGREGFPAVFTSGHAQGRLRCTSELQEVAVIGDIAYTRSHDTVSVEPPTGAPVHLAGDRLTIYRRHPDGRWLLARSAHTLIVVSG